MENKRKLISLSFIFVLLASACLVFTPQASAALTWQTEEVTTAGSYPTSICIDPAGTIHLTYVEGGALKYLRQTGGVWIGPMTIVNTLSHYATSMAVDSIGNLYIVYEEGGDLKCVQRETSWIWTYGTIDTEGSYFGSYNSISIGSDNLPQVVYHDYDHDKIKYAKCNGGRLDLATWNVHEIDIQHYVGMYCSIAVDSNNKAHVSYHDYENAALMYAKLVSGTGSGLDDWDVKTLEDYVAGADFTGYDTSIALDSADKPFISFYDEKADRLKVLGDPVDNVWKYGIVDSGNFACTDFTINKATNAKYISYYDVANGNLKFATLSGGAWVPEIVDSNEDTGKYSSIALDASGNPHISYIDETNGKIKHAWLAESVVDTSLTVNYTPDTVDKVAGETATISGKLTVSSTGAAIGGATIHLSYRGQTSMTEGDLGDVVTQPDGTYSYLWAPGADIPNDNYIIRANYEGQVGAYNPSMIMSMPPGLFVVPEYAFGALLAIIAMFAAYAVAKKGFSGLASGLGRR